MPEARVRDVMTRDVVTLMEADNLATIAADFNAFRFRHLPVVDGKRLVGIVRERDLWRASVSELDGSAVGNARAQTLSDTFVARVMSRDPVTASPNESLAMVADRMLQTGVGALPVVNAESELLGIVTEYDLLRHLAASSEAQ